MDIRSISCLVVVMVFIIVPFIKGQVTAAPKTTKSTVSPGVSKSPSPGVVGGTGTGAGTGTGTGTGQGTGTGTGTGTGGGSGQTNKPVTSKPPSAAVVGGTGTGQGTGTGTGTGTGGGSVTVAPPTTTPAPKQCVMGSCTAKGDDESCIKNAKLTNCPITNHGSCTTDVTKNGTYTTVVLGCRRSACANPGTPTTSTAKPSTASTSTCCNTNLCNQIQNSAAVRLTTNMIYAIGLVLIKAYM